MKKRIRERLGRGKGGRTVSDDPTEVHRCEICWIRTSVKIFETSKRDKPQYFVDVVKDKRRTKNNNLEFLGGRSGPTRLSGKCPIPLSTYFFPHHLP
jgi:hypothetical protein